MLPGASGIIILLGLWAMLTPCSIAQEQEAASRGDTLRVGYSSLMFSNISKYDAQAATKVWVDALLKRMVKKYSQSETIILDDIESIEQAVEKDRADIFILMSYDFLRLEKQYGLIPFVIEINDEPGYENFCILTRKDSGIREVSQLRGKKIIIDTNLCGDTPQIWLDVWLADHQLPSSTVFFSNIKRVSKPSPAILPVFFKQADACLVRVSAFGAMSELNPQLGTAIAPLITSEELRTGVTCFNPKIDPETRKMLSQCIMSLDDEPEGKQILTLFKVNRLELYEENKPMKAIRGLMSRYEELRKRGAVAAAESTLRSLQQPK